MVYRCLKDHPKRGKKEVAFYNNLGTKKLIWIPFLPHFNSLITDFDNNCLERNAGTLDFVISS